MATPLELYLKETLPIETKVKIIEVGNLDDTTPVDEKYKKQEGKIGKVKFVAGAMIRLMLENGDEFDLLVGFDKWEIVS